MSKPKHAFSAVNGAILCGGYMVAEFDSGGGAACSLCSESGR